MQSGYFATAWADIKNSPGWFGKLCLLALVSFIPIFGPIAVAGYLFGWARDMAWNIHKPLPEHIFGNEDGKQYSRGFFYYIITIVFFLIPSVIDGIYGGVTGATTAMTYANHGSAYGAAQAASAGIGGILVTLVTLVLYVAGMFFIWVGTMRMSIYGRLSAGLQFGKIWAMMRHDSNGLWRIFGMVLLVGLIVGIAFTIVITILTLFGILVGIAGTAPFWGNLMDFDGYGYGNGYDYSGLAGALMPIIVIAVIVCIALVYLTCVATMFVSALQARALGYWTRQFDVTQWRGQDDPMPFEMQPQAAAQGAPYGQQQAPYYAPPTGQPNQPTQPFSGQQQPIAPYAQPAAQQTASTQPLQPDTAPTTPIAETIAPPAPAAPTTDTTSATAPTVPIEGAAAAPTAPIAEAAPANVEPPAPAATPASADAESKEQPPAGGEAPASEGDPSDKK